MKSMIISVIVVVIFFRQSVAYEDSCDKCLKYAEVVCAVSDDPPCINFNTVKYCTDGLGVDAVVCPAHFSPQSAELKRLIESGEAYADKICILLKECQYF
ncbi:hypothetical protein DdX_19040 [Ditylenchus destructor]|uniref:Uncharacterized protein n=1 Tax=Ditylenchus destructor TaxID=166010 RepID=A0AAD4MKF9_9BILA|nr:hypothetical protein DdX_19040 [Ditylenchus destructor]